MDTHDLIKTIVRTADHLDQIGMVKAAGFLDDMVQKVRDIGDAWNSDPDDDDMKARNDLDEVVEKIKAYERHGLMDDPFELKNQRLQAFISELKEVSDHWQLEEKINMPRDNYWHTLALEADTWNKFLQKELGNRYDVAQKITKAIPNVVGLFDFKK